MAIDILIFAVIAVFLIYRLNSVLGTRNPDDRQRPNPFAGAPAGAAPAAPAAATVDSTVRELLPENLGDSLPADPEQAARVRQGLEEIMMADRHFDLPGFVGGARAAFEMIVTAYARGDLETLRPLLSPKLFSEFEQGVAQRRVIGHTTDITVHRILRACVIEAHLGGTMAYVTVDFDVEQTTVTRDADGKVAEGDPDRIFSVRDIWTFTRDTRAADPNWLLIETRAGGDA